MTTEEVEGHKLSANTNEAAVEDDGEVDAHGLALNTNEAAVEDDDDVEDDTQDG
jgi:hypothetical protein